MARMVSNLTKIGLIVIVCSFLFGVIAQSLNLPFLTEEHFQSGLSDQIPIDGSYIDIPLIEGISHPFSFQIIVEWYFHSPSGSEFSVSSSIIITKAGQVMGTIPGTINDNNWVSSDDYLQRHYITVPSKYGSSSFSLFARVQGQPASQEAVNDLYLEDIRVKMTYIIFYMIISPLLFLAGIALVIAGYIIGRKQRAKKPVDVKWEPTLKWRGESPITGETKAPKMAIKTTPQPKKKVKKVVKKASPIAGDTKTCKFCGKSVQRSAFFCPHCYGKLS
jgi:hypothetical protein